ncbi:hypothetical protein BH23CHL7_BH23CHL7_06350 [soil metagenome]
MKIRRIVSLLAGLALIASLSVSAVFAYEGEVAEQVVVNAQARLDCPTSTTATATVTDTAGDPIEGATVTWSWDMSNTGDSFAPSSSTTNADGEATTELSLAETPGQRVIRATVDDASATTVVRCEADALPDTSTASGVPASILWLVVGGVLILMFGAFRIRAQRPLAEGRPEG